MARTILAIVLMLEAVPTTAAAFTLKPFVAEFAPSGKGANKTYKIQNDSAKPIAVQISMTDRRVDLDGNETNSDAEDDFLVYPPQMIIPPNTTQTVRVQYIGKPNPAAELAYRIVAEQLPVKLDKSKEGAGGVALMVRYSGAIYIVPPGAKGRLEVESVRAASRDGKKQLEITLVNSGNRHVIPKEPKLRLAGSSGPQAQLSESQLPGLDSTNVLAGKRRRLLFDWPEGLVDGPWKVDFDFVGLP